MVGVVCARVRRSQSTISSLLAKLWLVPYTSTVTTMSGNMSIGASAKIVPSQWYVHMPTPVRENSQFKILWDLAIQTDKTIPANRPDIVVLNKSRQTVQIIDVSIPHDNNITKNIKRKFRNIEISDLKLNVCGMSRPWSYL
eukprot:m.248414 g.248414  ORF g.248414 m.248414 type:complete len:141 (+) comp40289_c0_seq5:1469-1891(+)